jgi:hypothetical protein
MAKITKNIKWLIVCFLTLIFAGLLLSYRLLETPPGLTSDEASFGYNAALLAKTGHDENGKSLPFFVLSLEGKDWRQPVTQYATTLLFKIIGPSEFNLRFMSVIVSLISLVLILFLINRLWGKFVAVSAAVIFVTTPIIFIQSHMGLDNIMPVPFVVGWLFSLFLYRKTNEKKYAVIAGVCLGIAFYSYKAMRIIVPVLGGLSLIYLWPKVFYFLLGIAPFVVIIPFLRSAYPGALAGGFQLHNLSWDGFFLPYLSSFDPSFLFIKGDDTVYHSTGMHGMFLLATLPLFLTGIYQAIKSKNKFLLLVLVSFLLAPIGMGLVNSIHRASRLLALVPFYVILSALGVETLKSKKLFLGVVGVLMFLNFYSFVRYYWFTYPKFAQSYFSQTSEKNYTRLADFSKENELSAYIDRDLYNSDGVVAYFYEAAYFDKKLNQFSPEDVLPGNAVLMTYKENLEGVKRVEELPNYFLYVKE